MADRELQAVKRQQDSPNARARYVLGRLRAIGCVDVECYSCPTNGAFCADHLRRDPDCPQCACGNCLGTKRRPFGIWGEFGQAALLAYCGDPGARVIAEWPFEGAPVDPLFTENVWRKLQWESPDPLRWLMHLRDWPGEVMRQAAKTAMAATGIGEAIQGSVPPEWKRTPAEMWNRTLMNVFQLIQDVEENRYVLREAIRGHLIAWALGESVDQPPRIG